MNSFKKRMIFFTFSGIFLLYLPKYFEGDSIAAAIGSKNLVHCFVQLQQNCPNVPQFGFAMFLPTLIPEFFGFSTNVAEYFALFISSGLFILATYWNFKRKVSPNEKKIFSVLLLSLPLYYSRSTFSEIFVISLGIFGIGFLRRRRYLEAGLFLTLFSTTRELYIGIGILLALAELSNYQFNDVKIRTKIKYVVSQALVSTSVVMLFNFYRWRTIRNPIYFSPIYFVKTPTEFMNNLLGLFFSPSGGILLFAPVPLVYFIFFLRNRSQSRYTIFFLLCALTLNIFSCAIWFAPLGWISWGPRLMIPLIFVLVFQISPISHLTKRQFFVIIASGLPIAILSLSETIGGRKALSEFFSQHRFCDIKPIEIEKHEVFYKCLRKELWAGENSMFIRAWHFLGIQEFLISIGIIVFYYWFSRLEKVNETAQSK